jgi:hypothetical protein
MASAVRLLDNNGVNIPPGVIGYTPVLGTGQKVTDAAVGGNHELALTAGKTYILSSDITANGGWLLGLATTATAANVIWYIPPNGQLVIHMPAGYATLHYQALADGASLYVAEVKS